MADAKALKTADSTGECSVAKMVSLRDAKKAAWKVCCLAAAWVSKKAVLWVALWDAKTVEQMVC